MSLSASSLPSADVKEVPRWWLRHAVIALFYMVVATGLFSPMASNDIIPSAPDHANHVAVIIQAKLAVDEGQFPIRVAPWQHRGYRYPTYQFYAPLPYTVGQAVYRHVTPANPFAAYKLVEWGSLVLAGFFTYLSAWFLTRDRAAALLGGLLFMSAPYVLTNVHARGAFTEVVAQGLLAALFYTCVRAYYGSWRAPWMGLAGLAWASLALSHNITYLYGGIFFGLMFVMIAVDRRGIDSGLWRVGVGFALGVLIAMYFLAPILLATYLAIHGAFGTVQEFAWLTPISTLLSPISQPPQIPPGLAPATRDLNPAVGWPTLAGVGLLLVTWRLLPGRGAAEPDAQRISLALVVMFVLAFVMTWSPVDFWAWLPKPALVVQFSYRLLTFVAFPGALLTAYALAFGQRERLDARQAVAGIVLILIGHSSFLPRLEMGGETVLTLLTKPRVGYGDGAYLIPQGTQFPGGIPEWRKDLPVIDQAGRLLSGATAELSRDELRAIADLRLELEGETGAHIGDLLVFVDDRETFRLPFTERLALAIEPFREIAAAAPSPVIRLRLAFEPAGAAAETAGAPGGTNGGAARADIRLSRAALAGFAVTDTAVMPVRETQRHCGPDGDTVACRVNATSPKTLVQLPALFYPDMLDVRIDGRPAPGFMFRMLGYGLTGVSVEPGTHEVRVRFRGLVWANLISTIALLLTLAGVIGSILFARARRDGESI